MPGATTSLLLAMNQAPERDLADASRPPAPLVAAIVAVVEYVILTHRDGEYFLIGVLLLPPAAGALAVILVDPWGRRGVSADGILALKVTLGILLVGLAITFVLRQLPAARYPFNDLKNKKRYRAFYEHYKQVYNEVRGRAPRFGSVDATPAAPTGTTH